MARTFVRASSQSISNSSSPVSIAYPFTMAIWCRPTDNNNSVVMAQSTDNIHYVAIIAYAAPNNFAGQTQNGGSASVLRASSTWSTGNWYHVAMTDDGSTKAIFVNGLRTSGAEPNTFPAVTTTFVSGLPSNPGFQGSCAEASIWNAVLTDAEISALAQGAPASRIRASKLQFYWPLWGIASPEADVSGGRRNGTVNNGATLADHAPVGRYAPFPNPYSRAATFVNASGLYVPQRTLRGVGT